MKRKIISLLVCMFMIAALCSCKNGTDSCPTYKGTEPTPESTPKIEPTSPTDPTLSPDLPTEPGDPTEPAESTAPPTEPSPDPTEPPTEPTKPTEPKSPALVTLEYSQKTYTVNDPENTKGLSTKSNGFSYGVAKNGVAHDQSIINQRTFDGYANVDALALDTETQEKVMYLTFDNGYEYENLTADILDTLKEKDVKAAFFVTLSYAKQNPELVRRMIDEGHIVGNHSATHPSFPKISRTEMAKEIAELDNYLVENFSYSSPYFRFPSGEYSECALELVTSIGFRSIFWSAAYADWDTSTQNGADYAFSTVTSRFHSGAVILLHAVSRDNAEALGRIIDEARNQGYALKTLDDYFSRNNRVTRLWLDKN